MASHLRHSHGHVHGHKRDGHADGTRHENEGGKDQEKQQNDGGNGDVATAVSVVYVTLPKTFSGPAVMSTLTGGSSPTNNAQAPSQTGGSGKSGNNGGDGNDGSPKASPSASAKSGPDPTHSVSSTVQTTSLDTAPPRTTFATSTSNAGTAGLGAGASASANSSMLPDPSMQGSNNAAASSQQQTSSMSSGAAAGLAVGLIMGIAVVAGVIYYLYRKKTRLGKHEELMNEKHASLTNGAGTRNPETAFRPVSAESAHTASTAPRLSLRPVTQFAPVLNGNANKSSNSLNVSNPSLAVSDRAQSSWERRQPNTASNNPREDPFADAAVVSEKRAGPESPPANPFDQPETPRANLDRKEGTHLPATGLTAAATATSVAASAAAPGEKSERPNSKASVESSTPPTPASVKSNPVAPAGPTVAGAPVAPSVPRAPNNVHRVQLDFKPSMDDELELRSGQLVRLLHEYDDGWALCIRMDRSQQGVAPRTCLSKLPVKPRPQGPPPNGRPGPPQSRPGTPQGRPGTPSGRPGTSHGPGPQSRPGTSHGPRGPPGPGPRGPPSPPGPNGTTGPMVPRPLTPSQANRDRSQSVTAGEAQSGVPPRKPVPGQAM